MGGRHRVFDFNQAQVHLFRPKLVLPQAGLLIGSKYGCTTLAEPFFGATGSWIPERDISVAV